MAGQILVYWNLGIDELEHFLLGMFDFPEVVIVLPRDFSKAQKFAEKFRRSIVFLDPEEMEIIMKPDFEFHFAKSGSSPETIAAKLKQDFIVVVYFGLKKGEPISLEHDTKPSTAAPIIVYEVLKLVKGF